MQRYVTDWAGPDATIRKIVIKLGAPNYPGDVMHLTGTVVGKDEGTVEIAVRGANSSGDHVSGTVTVEIP